MQELRPKKERKKVIEYLNNLGNELNKHLEKQYKTTESSKDGKDSTRMVDFKERQQNK